MRCVDSGIDIRVCELSLDLLSGYYDCHDLVTMMRVKLSLCRLVEAGRRSCNGFPLYLRHEMNLALEVWHDTAQHQCRTRGVNEVSR